MVARTIRFRDHSNADGVVRWKAFRKSKADIEDGGISIYDVDVAGISPEEPALFIDWATPDDAEGKLGVCFVEHESIEALGGPPDILSVPIDYEGKKGLEIVPNPISEEGFGLGHALLRDHNCDDRCPDDDRAKQLAGLAIATLTVQSTLKI